MDPSPSLSAGSGKQPLVLVEILWISNWRTNKSLPLKNGEPGAPYPTLSKEEKKRNFLSHNSLAFWNPLCLTVT